jgi:hypothetical protein
VKPAVVSAEDGSLGAVSERLMFEPSLTELGALKVAVGATLVTTSEKVVLELMPVLSVAVMVTVCD